MIQIDIKTSNRKALIGQISFVKNLIYVGSNHQCDIYLQDSEVLSNHLIIEIAEGKLIVHPHKDLNYFLVNGKRSTGHKFLKVNDTITIGETSLKIINFLETQYVKTKDHLNDITSKLIENDSPLLEIIQKVQEHKQ